MKILVLNGPNLNMLGTREPAIYGSGTYDDLQQMIRTHAEKCGVEVLFYQSNHEGALVDAIQQAYFDGVDGIVFNPGAYTHTSVALHDCIRSIQAPVVEVHISNVHQREEFRHHSMISAGCKGVICGFGLDSYRLAIEGLLADMNQAKG